MASEIIKGLFGFDPVEKAKQDELQASALAFKQAQLDPLQQASYQGLMGANMMRQGIGDFGKQLFGVQDPEVKENALLEQSARELLTSGVDPMSSEGLTSLLQRMNAAGARPQTLERLSYALQNSRMNEAKIGVEQSKQRENIAQAALAEMNLQDRQKLALELANLPPNATDQDKMNIVMKYSRNPDVLIQGINQREAARERADARKREIEMQTEARLEAARQANANARQLEYIRQEGRMDLERLRQEDKKERAQEKRYEGFQKAERAAENFIDNAQTVAKRLDAVKARINNRTAGVTGAALSRIWATEAQAVKLELESIGSNIGFDKLTEMRQSSPTGGALGSVSDYEGKQLRNAVASLENTQDPKILRDNIDSAIKVYNNIVNRVNKGLEQDRSKFRNTGTAPSGRNITVDF